MEKGDTIILPKDNRLTKIGVESKMKAGEFVPLSKYKVLNVFWEEVYYPYPHSTQRIELKKGAGLNHICYMETVKNIMQLVNQ